MGLFRLRPLEVKSQDRRALFNLMRYLRLTRFHLSTMLFEIMLVDLSIVTFGQ